MKPALLAMMEGEHLVIGPEGQHVLGRWLLKNALVREMATPRNSPMRVSTHEQRMMVASDVLPMGWRMAIGSYEGFGPHLSHSISNVREYSDENGVALGSAVLHTFRIECFVGQVLIHTVPWDPDVNDLLGGSDYAIEIPQMSDIAWPTRRPFNEEWIERIQRLGTDRVEDGDV